MSNERKIYAAVAYRAQAEAQTVHRRRRCRNILLYTPARTHGNGNHLCAAARSRPYWRQNTHGNDSHLHAPAAYLCTHRPHAPLCNSNLLYPDLCLYTNNNNNTMPSRSSSLWYHGQTHHSGNSVRTPTKRQRPLCSSNLLDMDRLA